MSTPHDLLMAFADGELNEIERAEFRLHLADCRECQEELAEILQLKALERGVKSAKVVPLQRASWRTTWSIAAAGLLAAGLAAVVLRSGDPEAPRWTPGSSRGIEPWISWSPASEHRPYDVPRAAANVREEIPLGYLADLEKKEDHAALGAAWMLRGEPRRAIESLQKAPATAEQASDLAAAHLLAGELKEALKAVDRALEMNPLHAPARFNRALILDRLGLSRSAAQSLGEVAGKGWAEEAAQRAVSLKQRSSDNEALYFVQKTLDVALNKETLSEAEIRKSPAQAIEIFTLALLTAKNAAEIDRLAPAAKVLDQISPKAEAGKHLEHARQTLSARAKLAQAMERMIWTVASYQPRFAELKKPALEPIGEAELFQALKDGAPDQQIAAIFFYRKLSQQKNLWENAAKKFEPPFFACASGWASFTYDWLGGPSAARGLEQLNDTITRCRRLGIERNAARAEFMRAHVLFFSRNLVEAEKAAQTALLSARRLPDLRLESQALEVLFNIARYRHDAASTRAFGEELVALDPQKKEVAVKLHESLATLHLFALETDAARREMSRAHGTGAPLTIAGAFVLADLYRLTGRESDYSTMNAALEQQRPEEKEQSALLIRHIRATAEIRKNRGAAQEALRAIIADAGKLSGDATARSAIAYSISLLALEAGEDRRFEEVVKLIAEEQNIAPPDRCLLAVERHLERQVVVAIDAGGAQKGLLIKAPAPLEVPNDLQESLKPCETVVVLARPILHGTSKLLDKSIAFTYAVGVSRQEKKAGGPALYVTGVTPPPSAALAPLAPVPEELMAGAKVLSGPLATPERVLAELSDASWVEIHAHGKLEPEQSDAAAIALSPDASGAHLLLAEQVARAKLSSAPVILAACNAAEVRREDLFLPAGLPVAFLRAGATAVIAGDAPIPDAMAPRFFHDLRRRVEAGATVPRALRDTRLAWIADSGETWVESIVVFEPHGSRKEREQ